MANLSTTGQLSTVVGPNTKLSYAQIEGLWVQAGGDPKLASLMAAIAMAESGGHPFEINDDAGTGDYSVGLWQVNYFDGLAQSRTAAFGSPESLRRDPLAQSRAAISILKSQGLSAWTTYTRGTYQQFLQGGVTPDTSGTYGSGSGATATTAGNVLGTTDANCLIPYPSVQSSIGLGSGSGGCLLTKDQAHKLLGGLLVAAGVGIMGLGILIMVTIAFRRKGQQAIQVVTGITPGGAFRRGFGQLTRGQQTAAKAAAPAGGGGAGGGGRTTVNVTSPGPSAGANPPKGPGSTVPGPNRSTKASAARLRSQGPTIQRGQPRGTV